MPAFRASACPEATRPGGQQPAATSFLNRKASPPEAPQSSFIEFRVNLGGTNFDISTPAKQTNMLGEGSEGGSEEDSEEDSGGPEEGPEEEVAEESQRVVAAVVFERSPSGTDSPTEPYRPSEKALGKRKAVESPPEVDGVEFLDDGLPGDAEESTEPKPVFKADKQSAKEPPSSKPHPECNCTGVEHETLERGAQSEMQIFRS
ncbi:hypothetical protein NLJ89_g6645 [Agrocybe chaxingu]|uniref:Uncharacterized protein n=1 Tax=Agrocybe chaxingu TaxID=84603 RepID=A0A9W8JYR2_9AGAR|nr:hypothetical protein NLJ89_g6645 [Agrocybe chaxingu]